MNDVATTIEPTTPAEAIAAEDGLAVVSIAKAYDKRVVLSDVSLTVGHGEVVGLLGPNGAGKTTCFYSVMGLVKPDSGRIMLDGTDITGLPMYRRAILGLGYLPQETSIFRGLSVEKNILAVLELAEPNRDARQARLDTLLDEFGLTRLRASPAMALSGGERRRAEIARALAADPTIMLLDEPFAGIDPISIADIRLLVSHYTATDTVRRVVGVGSVGTRCYVTVLVARDGSALLMQTKEAGRSVLVEYGGCPQSPEITEFVAQTGEGGRVVALQRILQGVSDPLLGHFRGTSHDYYVRQFRDMKGGIDAETLDDATFRLYAKACAAVLARAHGQSPTAGQVVGYIGDAKAVTEAIVEWSYAYAALSRADYDAFVAAAG